MMKYYLVSGRFEIYDKNRNLITNQYFLNKIFEAPYPLAAINIGISYVKRKISREYGKGAVANPVDTFGFKETHAPEKNKRHVRKEKFRNVQGKLF